MPQDWFAQFAPLAQVPQSPAVTARISSDDDDWFSQFSPTAFGDQFARDAGVRVQIDEVPSDPLGRFIGGAWGMLNPIEAVKGVASAVRHPIDTVTGIAQAQGQQFAKAADAYDQGRYSEMLGHGAAGMLPLLGPVAANIGEQIGSGDVAGGLGATTGLVTGVLAPGALARRAEKGLYVPPLLGTALDPVSAAAVAAGQKAGVAIDAATATGNRFIQAAQHYSDRMLGGAGVAGRAGQAQAQGLASMGEQLAAKANQSKRSLAEIAADEGQYLHGSAADFDAFKPGGHGAIYVSEVKSGGRYGGRGPGSKTQAEHIAGGPFGGKLYKVEVDESKVKQFDPLNDPLAKSIYNQIYPGGRVGGMIDYTDMPEFVAAAKPHGYNSFRVSEPAVQGFSRAFTDPSVLKITGKAGKGADGSFTQMQPGSPVTMEQAGAGARSAVLGEVQKHHATATAAYDTLRKIEADPANLKTLTVTVPGRVSGGGPTINVPQSIQVALPVDLRQVKAALSPSYKALKRESELVPLMGDKARALTALDRLLSGDDYAPLSVVDSALGDLKSFARSDVPELRSVGQGAAAHAVQQLDAAVMKAAADAGPEAVAALKAGRSATIAKYVAADVLKGLSDEPVKVARGATVPKDAAIGQLRELAKQAPGELPKIGRAVLDDLLAQATQGGGFEHAAKIAADWQKLGRETKLLLFKDPGYIKDLDNFFNLARMTARNANPSGTASTTAAGAQMATLGYSAATFNPLPALATVAGPYAVSKFLHSAAGVRLLTKGFKIPGGNKAAQAAYMAQLSAFAQKLGTTNPNERQMQPVPISR